MQNCYMGCAICGKPLRLDAANTQDGLPVHDECNLLRLKLKEATTVGAPHIRKRVPEVAEGNDLRTETTAKRVRTATSALLTIWREAS
jgi:hypothetical protein